MTANHDKTARSSDCTVDAPEEVQAAQRQSPSKCLAVAHGEVEAAGAVLADPAAPNWAAWVHALRCLEALEEAAQTRPTQTRLANWLEDDELSLLRQRLETSDHEVRGEPTECIRALAKGVRNARREILGLASLRLARRSLVVWGIAAAMLIGVVVSGLALTMPALVEGPWRGAYFSNTSWQGEPVLRRESELRFTWRGESKRSGDSSGAFSARWDTCMSIDDQTDVVFQLVSSGESRLSVDGRALIHHEDGTEMRSRGASLVLSAGVHHLQVEYASRRPDGGLALVASLDGGPPRALPVRMLRLPIGTPDDRNPCGHVPGS